MNTTTKTRFCSTCNRTIFGRKDKIYCGSDCKNKHHREAKKQVDKIQSSRNKNLIRNNIVLEGIFGLRSEKIKIHRNLLFKFGYDIFTHELIIDKKRKIYKISNYIIKVLKNGLVEITKLSESENRILIFFKRWIFNFPNDLRRVGKVEKKVRLDYFERISEF